MRLAAIIAMALLALYVSGAGARSCRVMRLTLAIAAAMLIWQTAAATLVAHMVGTFDQGLFDTINAALRH